jgi:hypothetical protein
VFALNGGAIYPTIRAPLRKRGQEKEDRRKVPQGIADTAYQCGPSNRVGFVSGLDLFLAFAAKYIQGSIKNFKL